MTTKNRTWPSLWAAAVGMAFMFAASARAEAPRDEIAHAYQLIKTADADYGGHRAYALEHLKAAGKRLDLHLEGDAPERERQRESDWKMREARRLIVEARDTLEGHDRERAKEQLNKTIDEIDAALHTR